MQWWHKLVGATDKNQNKLKYGNGVRVGIIDGTAFGVNPNGTVSFIHPDFGNRMDSLWGYPTAPGNWSNYSTIGDDHGTHVAGIVGAGRDGVGMRGIAPGVRFTSVGVFANNGFVGTTMDALKRTAESGGTIANMSYGPVAAGILISDVDIAAVLKYKKKVFISKAAGNDGVKLKTLTLEKALSNMIIVGAVNENKKIASFSNLPGDGCFQLKAGAGCKTAKATHKYMYRFLVAPGVDILSTQAGGGYVKKSGTSMAAPIVAGAAALLQSKWTFLKTDPKKTADILLSTAEDLGKTGVDSVYGRGLLRVDRAMQAQGQTTVAVGKTVDGPGFDSSDGGMILPRALGKGHALKAALNNMVVFDEYGRDFKLADAGGYVQARSNVYSVFRHFENRFEMADQGALVSMQMANGFNFTGVVADRQEDELATVTALQKSAQRTSMAGYMDYMQDDRDVWQLDGEIEDFRFSFGQRTGLARDISFGAPQDIFLFDAELMAQPLMSMGEQSMYAFSRYGVSKNFGVAFGFAETNVDTGAIDFSGEGQAYLLQADYQATSWLGLQLTQSMLSESDTMLGGVSLGPLALGSEAATLATGAAVSINILPSITARLHFTESVTEADAASGSLFREVDALYSRSYGLSLIRTGIFGQHDQLGISASKPLYVHAGDAVLETPTGRTDGGDVIYNRSMVSLAAEGSQTDLDLGYRATLGSSMAFGLNVFYQDEVDHDPDEWNAGVLARLRMSLN